MTSRIKEDLKEIAYTFPESFYDDGDDDIAVSYTHLTLPTKA